MPIDVFEKFAFPTAMVIILLMAVCGLFFLLWRSAEKREAQLQADLKESRAIADTNNKLFIESLKAQNQNTSIIAQALAPVKSSTDLLPSISSDLRETLRETNHIVDLVRERGTQPLQNRRKGDPNK